MTETNEATGSSPAPAAEDGSSLGPGQTIEHLAESGRFRVVMNGRQVAELRYVPGPGIWDMTGTYADPELRGTGTASAMVAFAMDAARAAGVKIIPSCPYLPVWLRRNPSYQDLVARV